MYREETRVKLSDNPESLTLVKSSVFTIKIMTIPVHIAVNTLLSFPIQRVFEWDWRQVLLFIIVGGFLIDIDHPLYFGIKHKTASLKQLLKIGKKMHKKMRPGFYIFHSPEINLLFFFASFFYPIFIVVFLSNFFHIILDAIEHYRFHGNFRWIGKWSIIYNLQKPGSY